MASKLPPWFGAARDSEEDDTERFARMTPEHRLAICLSVCDLLDSMQRHRPNWAALRAGQPRSEEAVALWSRLMRSTHE